MIIFPASNDVMIPESANRLLITNEHAEKDIVIRLPRLQDRKTFEVLLLSPYRVTLHTNSETTRFLAARPTLKLTVGGDESCVGRSIVINAFQGYWRIFNNSIPEPNIVFED
jgi:hypothetical protein